MHRLNEEFETFFEETKKITDYLYTDIKILRLTNRQINRSNHNTSSQYLKNIIGYNYFSFIWTL